MHQNDGDSIIEEFKSENTAVGSIIKVVNDLVNAARKLEEKTERDADQMRDRMKSNYEHVNNMLTAMDEELTSLHGRVSAMSANAPEVIDIALQRAPTVMVKSVTRALEVHKDIRLTEKSRGWTRLNKVRNRVTKAIRKSAEESKWVVVNDQWGGLTETQRRIQMERFDRIALEHATTIIKTETERVPRKVGVTVKGGVKDASLDLTYFNALTTANDSIADLVADGKETLATPHVIRKVTATMTNTVDSAQYTDGGDNELTLHTPGFDSIGSAVFSFATKVLLFVISGPLATLSDFTGIPIEDIADYTDENAISVDALKDLLTSEPGGGDVTFGVRTLADSVCLERMGAQNLKGHVDGDKTFYNGAQIAITDSVLTPNTSERSGPFTVASPGVNVDYMCRYADAMTVGKRTYALSKINTDGVIVTGALADHVDYAASFTVSTEAINHTTGAKIAVDTIYVDDRLIAAYIGGAWYKREAAVNSPALDVF
jgi:hypothetical protein